MRVPYYEVSYGPSGNRETDQNRHDRTYREYRSVSRTIPGAVRVLLTTSALHSASFRVRLHTSCHVRTSYGIKTDYCRNASQHAPKQPERCSVLHRREISRTSSNRIKAPVPCPPRIATNARFTLRTVIFFFTSPHFNIYVFSIYRRYRMTTITCVLLVRLECVIFTYRVTVRVCTGCAVRYDRKRKRRLRDKKRKTVGSSD